MVVPLMAISTILCGSVSLIFSSFGYAERRQIATGRLWARSLLWLAGIKVEVEGADRIDPGLRYVFVSNHLSYTDTPVVFSYLPEFRFLAKKGLFQIPFLGWHLKTAGHVPVPREDPRAALKTLSRAAELIQEKQTSLLIFSEGGRTMDGRLAEFKEGAAYLAIKAQAPLVPIALLSEIFFSSAELPRPVAWISGALPSTAMVRAIRAVLLHEEPLATTAPSLGILVVWAVATYAVAVKTFRWR